MEYLRDISADYSMSKLNQAILYCKACPCHNIRKSFPMGNSRASILIVSENISTEQIMASPDETNFYPLVNSSGGEFFSSILDYIGINKSELIYMNSVNCCTLKNADETETRTPKKSETVACKTFVNYLMDIVNPCGVLLLGSVAMNLWNIDSITNARGKFIFANRIPAMPTYHPDFFEKAKIFKSPEQIEDLKKQFLIDVANFFEYFYKKYPDSNIFLDDPSDKFIEIKSTKK